jgi:hypothetical protein
MAEKQNDSPSFSIEETMTAGAGDQQLFNDLISPETVSGNADDLKPVEEKKKEEIPEKKNIEKKTPEKKLPEKKEEIIPETEEDETKKGQNAISSFLEKEGDEEEEEEEVIPEKKEKIEGEEEPEPSKFNALAKDLFKLGVFTKEDDDDEPVISTPEEFLERFQNEGKKRATEALQTFIGKFGDDYQNAFDAIFVKGADPKEYFAAYNAAVDYAQMDMTKESNQEAVIRQALTDQGLDPEDVKTELERLKNYGDLETVAAKHHKVLVKKEALKLQQIEQKAEEDSKQKTIIKNQYITNVQNVLQEKVKAKEFDGIPINSKLANELQDFLLVDRWKTSSGETLTDFDRAILELKRPENHANKVKLGLLLKIMEKDPTLSVIQKSGITKKTNEIFSETAKQVTKGKANVADGSVKKNSWFIQ